MSLVVSDKMLFLRQCGLPGLKPPALLDDQHHSGGDAAQDEDHGEDGPDEDNHHSVSAPHLAPILFAL